MSLLQTSVAVVVDGAGRTEKRKRESQRTGDENGREDRRRESDWRKRGCT